MNWYYVVALYDSNNRPKGYLRDNGADEEPTRSITLEAATLFDSEPLAQHVRELFRAYGGPYYAAVEQRRVPRG